MDIQLLPFQKSAFLECAVPEPGGVLTVFAHGLGIEFFFKLVCTHFASPAGLVLVLGCPDSVTFGFPVMTFDAQTAPLKRAELYLLGGLVLCTSQVLLLDLLQERLAPELVNGVLIYKAEERCAENGPEAFCLDLIYKKNNNLFIRVVSEAPESLALGFGNFERKLKALKCKNCYFYPRFRDKVRESLDRVAGVVQVIEVQVSLGKEAKTVQVLLIDLLHSCLKHVLGANKELDPQDYPQDCVLLYGFEQRLRYALGSCARNMHQTLKVLEEMRLLKGLLFFNLNCADRQAFNKEFKQTFAQFSRANLNDLPVWFGHDSVELLHRTVASADNLRNPKLRFLQEILQETTDSSVVVVTSSNDVRETLSIELPSSSVVLYDSSTDWLEFYNPSSIVIFDLSLSLIRQIELFKSRNCEKKLSVYYMMFVESSEEQRYLCSIRREREAFEKLINTFASLPLTVECEGAEQEESDASTSRYSRLLTHDSADEDISSDVLVDVRELRSSLPFALFKRSFRILPLHLDTADYILSDGVGIERKTVPDLQGSLASGRLLAQSERLLGSFGLGALLLELGELGGLQKSPFGVLTPGTLSVHDLQGKFALLLVHRPKLRVLWSGSLQSTADFFHDIQRRVRPGACAAPTEAADSVNGEARNVLLAFRGILDERNVMQVMRSFGSLRELFGASKQVLVDRLGKETGEKLFKSLSS